MSAFSFFIPFFFMRYELDAHMIAAVKSGDAIMAGIDHPAYSIASSEVDATVRDSLAKDLETVTVN